MYANTHRRTHYKKSKHIRQCNHSKSCRMHHFACRNPKFSVRGMPPNPPSSHIITKRTHLKSLATPLYYDVQYIVICILQYIAHCNILFNIVSRYYAIYAFILSFPGVMHIYKKTFLDYPSLCIKQYSG